MVRGFSRVISVEHLSEGPSSIWKPASWGAPPCPPEDTRLAELICTAVRRTRAQSTFSVFTGFPYPNVRVARERENPGTRLQRGPSVVSNWSSFQRYAQRWSDVQSGTIGRTRAHDQGTENKQKKSRANQGRSPHNTDTRCKTQAQQERTANEIYTSPRAHQASSRATSIYSAPHRLHQNPKPSITQDATTTVVGGKHAAAAHQPKDHPTARHRRHRPRHRPASAAAPHRQTHSTHGHRGQWSTAAPSPPPRAHQAQA